MNSKEFMDMIVLPIFLIFRVQMACVLAAYSGVTTLSYVRSLIGYEPFSQKQQWKLAWNLGCYLCMCGLCLLFLWYVATHTPNGALLKFQ